MYQIDVFSISFNSEKQFSEPQNIGVDAKIILHPKTTELGAELISGTFILYTKEAQQNMQMAAEDFLEYAKITFLAASGKIQKTKSFDVLNQSTEFQYIQKNIPIKKNIVCGIFALSSGEFIVTGFEFSPEVSESEIEITVGRILETLKEL